MSAGTDAQFFSCFADPQQYDFQQYQPYQAYPPQNQYQNQYQNPYSEYPYEYHSQVCFILDAT